MGEETTPFEETSPSVNCWDRCRRWRQPSWKVVKRNPRMTFAILMACTALGVLVAVAIALILYYNAFSSKRQAFNVDCSNRQAVLQAEVNDNLKISHMIRDMLASQSNLTLGLTNLTYFRTPMDLTTVYAQRVKNSDRAQFEKQYNHTIMHLNANYNEPSSPAKSSSQYALIHTKI